MGSSTRCVHAVTVRVFCMNSSICCMPPQFTALCHSYCTVTISGNNGETFRGFFVQCRLVADDVTRVGVFADTDDNTRLSSCPIDTVSNKPNI